MNLASSTHLLSLAAAAVPALCTACGPKYACAGLEGVGCTTVAETYLATSDPAWADGRSAQHHDAAPSVRKPERPENGALVASGLEPALPGQPILSQPRILRLWVKQWEDNDNDLHAGGFVFVRITGAEWMVR